VTVLDICPDGVLFAGLRFALQAQSEPACALESPRGFYYFGQYQGIIICVCNGTKRHALGGQQHSYSCPAFTTARVL
jgi:hypothetical protein